MGFPYLVTSFPHFFRAWSHVKKAKKKTNKIKLGSRFCVCFQGEALSRPPLRQRASLWVGFFARWRGLNWS
jgi:hypothetical protein